MEMMSPKELKAAIDANNAPRIVDLQAAHEYEHRHIPGAINVPDDEHFEESVKAASLEKETMTLLYGEFDELGKGSKAGEHLQSLGFTNVVRLVGGLMGWMEAGYMIEGGRES
jgi:rhodanese-related sulfurtransferase